MNYIKKNFPKFLILSFLVMVIILPLNSFYRTAFAADRPQAKIYTTVNSPTNQDTIKVNIAFNKKVIKFNEKLLSLRNCKVGTMSNEHDQFFIFELYPDRQGRFSVGLDEGVVFDEEGNKNIASENLEMEYDSQKPIIKYLDAAPSRISQGEISVTITYSDNDGTGMNYSVSPEVKILNLSTDPYIVSKDSYENNIWRGSVTINDDDEEAIGELWVLGGSDKAGNIADDDFMEITVDSLEPEVREVVPVEALTNDSTPDITIFVEEDVEYQVKNGLNVLLSRTGTGDNETFSLPNLRDNTYNLSIEAKDDIGNITNLNLSEFEVDTTEPNVTISSLLSSPTNSELITFDIEFSEEVENFTTGGIELKNATINTITGFNDSEYSIVVTPVDGTVEIYVKVGAARDDAGNFSKKSNVYKIVSDRTAPVLTEISGIPIYTNDSTPEYTFNSDDKGNITYTGSCFSNTVQAQVGENVVIFAPDMNDGTISGCGLMVSDNAGNKSDILTIDTFTIDTISPVQGSLEGVTVQGNTKVIMTSEPVVGEFGWLAEEGTTEFIQGDNMTRMIGDSLSHEIYSPNTEGTYKLYILDRAGNYSEPSENDVIVDNTKPTVDLSSVYGEYTNETSFSVKADFSEYVDGFTVDDMDYTNATIQITGNGGNENYTLTVTPNSNGKITIKVRPDTVEDTARNSNLESNIFEITYDNELPTISITTDEVSPTNASSFALSFTFSEIVESFGKSDVSISNAEITDPISGDNIVYSVDITPNNDGDVRISLKDGNVADLAGNLNTASNELSLIHDTTKPVLVSVNNIDSPTDDSTPRYTFNSNEDGEIVYGGSCSSSLNRATTGDNIIDLNSLSDGTYSSCSIQVIDSAGNESDKLMIRSFEIDTSDDYRRDRNHRRRRRDNSYDNFILSNDSNDTPVTILDKIVDLPSNGAFKREVKVFAKNEIISVLYFFDTQVILPNSNKYTGLIFPPAEIKEENLPKEVPTDTELIYAFEIKANQDITFNKKVIVEIKLAEKYEGKDLLAYFYDEEKGEYVQLDFENIEISEDGYTIKLYLDHFTKFIITKPTEAKDLEDFIYSDINNHWSKQYVRYLENKGAIKPAPYFRPNMLLTRAEFLKICLEAFGIGTDGELNEFLFSDINTEDWKAKYAAKAKELGIISGYSDGTFKPDKSITRAEALKIILLISKRDVSDASAYTGFEDVPVDSWFARFVGFAKEAGLINGKSDTSFDPDGEMTRAEISKVVYKMLNE